METLLILVEASRRGDSEDLKMVYRLQLHSSGGRSPLQGLYKEPKFRMGVLVLRHSGVLLMGILNNRSEGRNNQDDS